MPHIHHGPARDAAALTEPLTVPASQSAADTPRCPCGDPSPLGGACANCVACDRCHTVVPGFEVIRTVRGSRICDFCSQQSYWRCEGCGGWNHDDVSCGNDCDDYDDEDDDADVDDPCPDGCDRECVCHRSGAGLHTEIHSYGYKPLPVFRGEGPLFLGPEIEVHTPYDDDEECAAIAHSHLGELGYLKHDESIDPGIEIVTHPMTYAWAIEHFPWEMLPELAAAGASVSHSTGLHVHLSRAGFADPLHIYRWMKFVYRNQPDVTRLAGRSSSYADFSDDDRHSVAKRAKGGYGNRHTAINTNNADTLELRVFASSLEPQTVQAAFGFAASSVEYTRDLNVAAIARAAGWSWPAYTAWLSERAEYAPLTQQLEALSCAC
ncbi:hypothetical protein [Cryptosporangium minutisporangium]|uniref:Amidoligase enzyme n=1 Tax=Cryptosporangium minutisporangium TaxID=113569 RepID=A0ABP6SW00_9ACTN